MTSFDYARSKETADRLLTKFGQSATLRRYVASGTAYDPTLTATDYPVTIADMAFKETQIDGTLVKRGDRLIYMAAARLAIAPAVADTLLVGSVEYKVIDVEPLQPGGTVVFYKMQARR